ncbi:hypothetical protein GWK08_01290 [Leptobacterium flavescens]|uniref:Uncharacterized protein n=1 Tax=Leptobacterium flavescens TaxID=472055 RepID=A0A6P0UHF5_9FLAO|nr:contractile injection system tape measure protein [Leptobacterium flavescens]NER12062.1 hypothetical protein [Leptobacterium flavescens]
MAGNHLIGKQLILLEFSTSDNTYVIQQKISSLFWQKLVPELNRLFDKVAGKNEVIRFDRIELDIGSIDPGNRLENNEELVARISRLLMEAIHDKLKSLSKEQDPGVREQQDWKTFSRESEAEIPENYRNKISSSGASQETPDPGDDPVDSPSQGTDTGLPLRRHYFDLWLYWLETGTLPSYSLEPNDNWILAVLETLGLEHRAVSLLEEKIKKHPLALERLILQHHSADLRSITELFTGYSQASLPELIEEISDLIGSTPSLAQDLVPRELEIEIWRQVFTKVIVKGEKANSRSLFKHIAGLTVLSALKDEFIQAEENIKALYPRVSEVLEHIPENPIAEAPPKERFNSEQRIRTEEEQRITDQEKKEMESPQFFKNAGMILLHPFLNHFFQKTKLVVDEKFQDHYCQSKAVLLLHFLATGEETVREYEMVLPKFLCAMPANIPIDHNLKITEEEKEEAVNMLRAVINHWQVLGNVSPEGLREGFLIREGKLTKEQTGWKLYVEQKTLDVLLDRLPWGLSVIKLPWMKDILKVDWR